MCWSPRAEPSLKELWSSFRQIYEYDWDPIPLVQLWTLTYLVGKKKSISDWVLNLCLPSERETPLQKSMILQDIKLANTTLSKMKLLRQKQEGMKEIERRRLDRESRRAQEERLRKYRQLELQHSQNSLQPSSADSGDSKLGG